MAVFLGNADYSPVKGYQELQGDFASINSIIKVVEGKIVHSDSNYYFCLIAESITDLVKADQYKANSPIVVPIHTKDYTRWTKDNPKTPTPVTALEKALTLYLSSEAGSQWLDKSFKGKINLNGNESVIEQVIEANFWKMLIELEECEPNLIKELEIKSPANGNGKGAYKGAGQTESQKITDRLNTLLKEMGAFSEGATNITELIPMLAGYKADNPIMYEALYDFLNLLVK